MLKGNLSTRPFYNDRLTRFALGGCAVLILLLTIFNLTRLVSLSSERSEIRAQLDADQQEAARIRAEAQAMQGRVDRATLVRLASSTREANTLIDQRTFSWTTLLGQLERTLPPDVRLTSISPRAERGVFHVSMSIVARELDDVDVFIDALRDTGLFYDVAPTEQRATDAGPYQAIVDASYLPVPPAATPPPTAGQPAEPVGEAR